MMKLNAIVIGATGLIGTELVKQLIEHPDFAQITILTRRTIGIQHPKIKENIIQFDQIKSYEQLVKGDILFSTLGTTIKKAGSKENQFRIDYSYQYELAKAAEANNVPNYVLVSSAGANPNSKIFYSKMKGDLDEAVLQLNFKRTIIFRPSILDGNRKEKRLAEQITLKIMRYITRYIFKKYKPTLDIHLAKAMINSITNNSTTTSKQIYEYDQLDQLI